MGKLPLRLGKRVAVIVFGGAVALIVVAFLLVRIPTAFGTE